MYLRIIIAAAALSMAVVAQAQSPYQVRYASHLDDGDSVVNITNSGARGADLRSGTDASTTGSICVNVYTFSPDEQMVSCCSCPVTPNGLVSLSAQKDLISNPLTPHFPKSIVVKLLATVPVDGNPTCKNSAAEVVVRPLAPGMLAWGTTIHRIGKTFQLTETAFSPATLSAGERFRLGTLCNFIIANGSGFGVCKSCRLGGLGAAKS